MPHTPEAHSAHEDQNAQWTAERSDVIAAAIRHAVPSGLVGMDYGCGPGHIGLRLADYFASMDLVDKSAEVIAGLEHLGVFDSSHLGRVFSGSPRSVRSLRSLDPRSLARAPEQARRPGSLTSGTGPERSGGRTLRGVPLAGKVAGRQSLQAYTLDLTQDSAPGQMDCVIASMSFHHVRETDRLMEGLARTVRPDGWLVVVDMDADDGAFHAAKHDFDGQDGFDRAALAHRIGTHGFEITEVRDLWSGQRWSGDQLIAYSLFMILARRSLDGEQTDGRGQSR